MTLKKSQMPITSSDKNVEVGYIEVSNLPMVTEIQSWIGLPIEQYTECVNVLVDKLQAIDDAAETSLTTKLLTENLTEHFANGMYAREVDIPAGSAVVSRIHMTDGISILAKGKILVMDRDGYKELEAPYTFTAKAGVQRIGLTITDCNWVSLFKADKQEGIDMLNIVTATTLDEYNRRAACQLSL